MTDPVQVITQEKEVLLTAAALLQERHELALKRAIVKAERVSSIDAEVFINELRKFNRLKEKYGDDFWTLAFVLSNPFFRGKKGFTVKE